MVKSPPNSSDRKQIEHLWNMEHPPGCCYSNRGMHIYKLRTSLAFHVDTVYAYLRACMSSASHVLSCHEQSALLRMTKNRIVVVCSVNCSALLNYSRCGKG